MNISNSKLTAVFEFHAATGFLSITGSLVGLAFGIQKLCTATAKVKTA